MDYSGNCYSANHGWHERTEELFYLFQGVLFMRRLECQGSGGNSQPQGRNAGQLYGEQWVRMAFRTRGRHTDVCTSTPFLFILIFSVVPVSLTSCPHPSPTGVQCVCVPVLWKRGEHSQRKPGTQQVRCVFSLRS